MDIKVEKVYGAMEKFKEIHTSNSKYLGDDDYFELLLPKNNPDPNTAESTPREPEPRGEPEPKFWCFRKWR